MHLVALTAETTPAWALPYCGGTITTTTCLLLYQGDGSQQLFYLDVGSFLFVPQAGSTDTIASTSDGGWALRRADGHVRLFNAYGYLVSDRDRFGNGFTVEYEPTPLLDLYEYHCRATAPGQEWWYRRCSVLAYLLDYGGKPDATDEAWHNLTPSTDFPLPPLVRRPAELAHRERILYGRDYFFYLINLGPDVKTPYGARRLRPVRVVDDLGRTFEFHYVQAAKSTLPPLTPESPVYDFSATPQAGLLVEVRGPAGAVVRFTYSRPLNYPAALNEFFLTRIERQDAPVAADVVAASKRTIEFQYQWPESQLPSYTTATYSQNVFDKYLAYYQAFVGCMSKNFICPPEQFGTPKLAQGDPAALARAEQNAYISDVADNIVLVKSLGVTESETRYEVNPELLVFDHVLAQRYGSSVAYQDASDVLSNTLEQWQTSLPLATFGYATAGPTPSNQNTDLTDAFLPPAIRQRYPLETRQTSSLPVPDQFPAIGVSTGDKPACSYGAMEQRRQELPGFQRTLLYTDSLSSEAQPHPSRPLLRSRLTCDQLAVAQLGDATHNDLISTLTAITITTPAGSVLTKTVPVQIIGQRAQIAANANRICGWTQHTDRDGFVHFFGLNYRGQVLVDALQERDTGDYIFSERLYNADGLVVQERRPTRGPHSWTENDGYTTFAYDEIDPAGNRGWNAWLPFYWSRRMNLLRVEERAAGGQVLNAADDPAGNFSPALGRYQRYGYEPLFNQVKFIEQGSVELRAEQPDVLLAPSGAITRTEPITNSGSTITPLLPTDVPHLRLDYIFDYQELLTGTSPISMSLNPVLDSFKVWGVDWFTQTLAAGQVGYNYAQIESWQLPLRFYGADLNGDGSYGFAPTVPLTGTQAYRRASGVPIVAFLWPGTSAAISQTTIMVWAPHGLPAVVRGSDGTMSVFEYYHAGGGNIPADQKYGQARPPTVQEVSLGYRGFLGQAHVARFGATYSSTYGPSTAPCPSLAGPYQWLLPATCSANPETELLALGLPPQTVQAILNSTRSGSDNRWLTTAYSYSELGQVRYKWTETGTTHTIRDTDGRPLIVTDPLSATTSLTYTLRGDPEHLVRTDVRGNVLEDRYQQFDEEGHVLYECAAWTAGGCPTPESGQLIFGTVQTYTYWPEGNLYSATDPEGLVTEVVYNERQLPVGQRVYHPQRTDVAPRYAYYSYNVDGDLTGVQYGDPLRFAVTTEVLTESFEYDGLRRLVTYTDTRHYAWQYAYSARDLLLRLKRDNAPYSATLSTTPSWETVLAYDALGRLETRRDNGITTTKYNLTNAGWTYAETADGFGTTYTTYDLLGQPVWSVDAAGNQTLYTWTSSPHLATTSYLRTDGAGTLHTTAVIDELDAAGQVITETEYGSGQTRQWRWLRNADGEIIEAWNPEGYLIRYDRNALGWPLFTYQQRTVGSPPEFDVAAFKYNQRGQVERVTDPAGQISEFQYTPFGELREQNMPGQPRVRQAFTFDGLGRVLTETIGTVQIEHVYDERGDPVLDRTYDQGIAYPLIERSFDDLGRLSQAVNYNYGLNWLLQGTRTVTEVWNYDSLGRVKQETLQVGGGPTYLVTSNWNLTPSGSWQRELSYDAGAVLTEWREEYDPVGRLALKERLVPGQASLRTSFRWLGDLYLGRMQDQAGRLSPFREERTVDAFGLPLSWHYTAIDLDQSDIPVHAQEGPIYCGAQWITSECARPLLQINVLRDVLGRVSSLQWQFGHPVFNSGNLVPTPHPRPWRGYTYNPMGQLDRTWEHAGTNNPISTTLETHSITGADVTRLGASSDPWNYVREMAVGGTTAIRNANTNVERWSLSAPRGPGHQLQRVSIDGLTRTLRHDAAGRIVIDGMRSYSYDPYGRLAAVIENQTVLEAYAYDAYGRLVAVFAGSGANPSLSFIYDGDQIMAGFDVGSNMPVWEATWGPQIDQLLEWRDLGGGTGDYIPLVDQRNSVVAAWNVDQARVTQTGEYNPEGRLLVRNADGQAACQEQGTGRTCSNPGSAPFGFISTWRSPVSGLVYMRNRWYSPELGQFTSLDPLGYADSYNSYAYVGFDVINGWDPWGLQGNVDPWAQDRKNLPSPQEAEKFRRDMMDRLSLGTTWQPPIYKEPDRRPLDERYNEMFWRNMNLAFGYAIGLGQNTTKALYGDDIPGDAIIDEMPGNLLAGAAVLGKASKVFQAASMENAGARMWAASSKARVDRFLSAADQAQVATGTSNQLGQTGMTFAQPLYGGPGTATEVTVEVGRMMDIAPALPWLNTSTEWEIKLATSVNQHVRAEATRDIARAARYGANAEIGWVFWKGLPTQDLRRLATRLETGGVIIVDAPRLAQELRAAQSSAKALSSGFNRWPYYFGAGMAAGGGIMAVDQLSSGGNCGPKGCFAR